MAPNPVRSRLYRGGSDQHLPSRLGRPRLCGRPHGVRGRWLPPQGLSRKHRRSSENRRRSPPPKGYATLQRLLRRRAVLVQAKTTLRQSLACLPELKASTGALMRHMARLHGLLKKRIVKTLVDLDWQAQAIGFGGQFAVDGILIGRQVDERQPSIHDRQNPVARLFNLTASFFTPASCPALFGPA